MSLTPARLLLVHPRFQLSKLFCVNKTKTKEGYSLLVSCWHFQPFDFVFTLILSMLFTAATRPHFLEIEIMRKQMPRPGFEPGLLPPQCSVLTTRRSRLGRSVRQNFNSLYDTWNGLANILVVSSRRERPNKKRN